MHRCWSPKSGLCTDLVCYAPIMSLMHRLCPLCTNNTEIKPLMHQQSVLCTDTQISPKFFTYLYIEFKLNKKKQIILININYISSSLSNSIRFFIFLLKFKFSTIFFSFQQRYSKCFVKICYSLFGQYHR